MRGSDFELGMMVDFPTNCGSIWSPDKIFSAGGSNPRVIFGGRVDHVARGGLGWPQVWEKLF